MTQVLHYIKHGIVLGPIREMNALIKANHILRVGAIWPNEYAYRLAALIGTSHNTNNKFRMSEHKPWIKTEIMESPGNFILRIYFFYKNQIHLET